MGERDRELLAKTLMAEAGNQGVEGMLAAGSVIMNRARGGGYGQGVEGVIMKPGAFSPWNSVTGFAGGQQGQNMAAIRPTMQAYQIADALLSGQYEDPTGGATHFYNPDISNPSWGTRGGGNWKRIGAHVFGRADDPQWRTAAISTQGAAKGDGAVAANQPRVLTQDDIETYNLTDAVPGDIATPEDIAKMGAGYTLNMPVPPEATQGVSVNQALANDAMDALGKTPSGLRTITVGENPAMPRAGTQPIALGNAKAGGVSDGREVTYAPRLAATGPVPASLLQQPVSNDPFEGLSKQQRTMLAFAAIADAGAALQGRQGTSFANTMGAFNEIRDQNRKREAIRQRNAMVAQLFGGGVDAAGGGMMSPASLTPESVAARKRQIFQAAAAGLIEPAMLKPMLDEIDAQVAQAKQAEAANRAREEKTDFIKPIVDSTLEYLNPGGKVDEQGNPILSPEFQNMATRTGARLIGSNEYNQFVGNIETIKSTYTFENMVDLKAQGVTFGALSESELAQVASLIGSLDPNNPLGTVRTLRRVNKMIDDANKRAAGGDQGTPASGPLTYDPATGKWSDGN